MALLPVELVWTLAAAALIGDFTDRDRAAMTRAVAGDAGGLAELYDRHGRLLYSLALRIMREQGDAEDIVQAVFTQAWTHASRYDPSRGTVAAWLLTMTRSRAIDRLRGRRSRGESVSSDTLAELPDAGGTPDDHLLWSTRAAGVREALQHLSALQRVAIELAFFEGLTHAEIAEQLELPLGTVKTRIRQGLITLRSRLIEGQS